MKDYIYRGIPVERHKWIYDLYKDTDKHFADGFVYGSLIQNEDKWFIAVSAMAHTNEYINNGVATLIEVERSTVGMYMMCEDKNDRMIFEGDILVGKEKRSNAVYGNGVYLGTTKWENNIRYVANLNPSTWTLIKTHKKNIEVVGNIHQEVK